MKQEVDSFEWYAEPVTFIAHALVLHRQDGVHLGFTSADEDSFDSYATYNEDGTLATFEMFTLKSKPGVQVTNLLTTSGPEVGNMELTTVDDGEVFTKKDVFGGLWRGTRYEIYRYNWDNDGAKDTLSVGVLGEIQFKLNQVTIELRDVRQYLQQDVGSVSQKTCRYRFGDAKCTVNTAAITHFGTVTTVLSQSRFYDSSLNVAYDHFGEGLVKFTSGDNAGMTFKIKVNGGTEIELVLFVFAPMKVGDTYEAIPGCRKRFEEDCKNKWHNELNFGGEPHRRGVNNLTASPGF